MKLGIGDDMAIKFTAYITLKDGTKIYAKDYGKKAFRIVVDGHKKKASS